MSHKCIIAGREVELAWSNESAKRYAFRLGTIGGEPEPKELRNPKTAAASLFKVLWGLLPPSEFGRHPTPEDLWMAVDHEAEAEAIFAAIAGVYQDRFVDPEKKSTLEKLPSPESS